MNIVPGQERRITIRMLSYWEKLRRNRVMPSVNDVNPEDLQDLWDNCFIVHLKDVGNADQNSTYIGKAILDAYQQGLSEEDDHRLISPDLETFMHHHKAIFESPKPLLEEGEFDNTLLGTVKYRQCILPLGENGKVEAILGGMHFKVFIPEAR